MGDRLRGIVSELNHGGVDVKQNEMLVIDTLAEDVTKELFKYSSGDIDYDSLKKALRNMFVLGQLYK